MYLKTPKRYTVRGRRPSLFSWGRLLIWTLIPALIYGGWRIYQARAVFAPQVSQLLENTFYEGQGLMATITAPAPTQDPLLIINRADADWLNGRVEDALVTYAEAIPNAPNNAPIYYRYTYGLILEGRTTDALESAEHTVTADPFLAEAWAVRALAQVRAGNAGGAVASGQHALNLQADNVLAYAFLTEAYIALEQFERASQAADRAVELDPDSGEAYYARAQVRQSVDFDRDSARADFMTAYSIAPYLTDAAVQVAYIDWSNGDYETGIGLLNEVRDANPENTSVLYALGFIRNAGLGQPSEAASVLAECVRIDPRNTSCHYYYGRVLLRLEQYSEAAQMLTRSVELAATDGTVSVTNRARYHYWAGEAQIYLGNCPQALAYLRPGYDLASTQGQDADLTNALAGSIQECTVFDLPTPTPTPDPNATPTAEAEVTPNV